MSNFGGIWTQEKIQIIEKYVKAYLQIMKNQKYFSLMYFDGFAGTGEISIDENVIEGAAKKILSIKAPRIFDMYYFVEMNCDKAEKLKDMISVEFPDRRNCFVKSADCNDKLFDLAKFLKRRENRNYKVLAFIDPFGMELKWKSLEILKGFSIDLWLLIPTGVAANRLLKNDGNIPEGWYSKLENFLGISKDEINKNFYRVVKNRNLFGEEDIIIKERNTIEKIHKLYSKRLNTIFNFVSDSFVMRNSNNSIMFHFLMATNNAKALKIANDIIKPKYKL